MEGRRILKENKGCSDEEGGRMREERGREGKEERKEK